MRALYSALGAFCTIGITIIICGLLFAHRDHQHSFELGDGPGSDPAILVNGLPLEDLLSKHRDEVLILGYSKSGKVDSVTIGERSVPGIIVEGSIVEGIIVEGAFDAPRPAE